MVIALCDSDREWLSKASEQIQQYKEQDHIPLEVLCFGSGNDLLSYSDGPIHAVFLEIELENENGIEIAAKLNEQWKNCQIVYCTDHIHYVIDTYRTKYLKFLVKSQFEEQLDSIMIKLEHITELENQTVYYHVLRGEKTHFFVKDIIYFERKTRFTEMVTLEGTFRLREKITEVMDDLPEGMFSRCHSCITVNLDQVTGRSGSSYKLKNGQMLPISRSFFQNTVNDYKRWYRD